MSRKSSESFDVQPPCGTPSAILEAASIDFYSSTCRRVRAAKKTQLKDKRSTKNRDKEASTSFPTANFIAEHIRYDSQSVDEWELLDTDEGGAQCYRRATEQDDKPKSWTPLSDSLNRSSPTSSQNSDSSWSSMSSASARAVLPGLSLTAHEVTLEGILKAMNDSLSIIVSDRRPRNRGGVILSGDTGFPRLDEIAPTLFSPGYLKVGCPC